MYIYNTTYLIAIKRYDEWLSFIKPTLNDILIEELGFENLSIMKLLSHQQHEDYCTIAVQCRANTMKKIEQWQNLYEPNFKNYIKDKFGDSALPFSTLMQEV